ncbi:hypothetical protein TWF281_010224 [Arthrobotrys megalospora]
MLSIVLYALLATGGNSAEIRRRQQELTLSAPKVIVQGGGMQLPGQGPQIQGAPIQGTPMQGQAAQAAQASSLFQPQGTYFTRPPGPVPSPGGPVAPIQNQNLVIPAAQPGSSGPSDPSQLGPGDTSSPPSGDGTPGDATITPGGTGRDLTNTPPALLGPNDTPGPNFWADVLPNTTPGTDDHTPTDGVSAEVQTSTNEAVGSLTEDQRSNLLENTSPEEFAESTSDFQQLVVIAAQDSLADSEAKAEAIAEISSGPPEQVSSLTQDTYTEIQEIQANNTEISAELSKTLRGLLDLGLDDLRNNATLAAAASGNLTDANGNPLPPLKKRWVTALISGLAALLEAAGLAEKLVDGGVSMWRKIKGA